MHALIASVREFTQAILNPYDPDVLLQRLTDQVAHALDAVGTGIMLADRSGNLDFAAASSPLVTRIELHQGRVEEGTCYLAFTSNRTITVEDVAAEDDRWPRYAATARELGLHAAIGVPLHAHGRTIGVLNVYRGTPTPWADEDVEACEIFAAMAAAYILHADQLVASRNLADGLERALESRGVIERAKGILMARDGLDGRGAFERLRQRSMDENRKLRDVARRLVDEHEHRDEAGGGTG